MKLSVPEFIQSIEPYKPGKPLEELEREYGISNSIKLASNENPLGPSPMAVKAMQDALTNLHRYPEGGGFYLTNKLSEKLGVDPGRIVLGNGSDDVIGMLARGFLDKSDEALMTLPAFLMYEIMVQAVGATPVCVPLKDLGVDLESMQKAITPNTRMIFITNPNNPTGTIVKKQAFKQFVESVPDNVIIVIDEAYIEFADDDDCVQGMDFIGKDDRVVVLRTFSKAYGLAGIRIGYGIMSEDVASILHRVRQPFNSNTLAQVGATAALDDEVFLKSSIDLIKCELDYLFNALDKLGVKYFPTQTNFFLIDVEKEAADVFEEMLRQGVIVRSMKGYGYPQYIRVTVGTREENIRFINALEKVLS